jgi:predicted glycosyltransferase
MRILIDIGHPAHVHLFRFFARLSIEKGDTVLFTYRKREHVKDLLKAFAFTSICFGPHYKGTLGKIIGLLQYDWLMLKTCLSFKPDILLSHGSMYAAQISRIIRRPHISFEDTFNMEQIRLYLPFTDAVLTGNYEHKRLGLKEIRYPGYHELAYLHPDVFTPDPGVKELLGVGNDERYAVVRFVAWNASHDVGHKGMSLENKTKLVKMLSERLKVFVSSEDTLPPNLKTYQCSISAEKMHDALAYAHMFVGESATMASECAVLGVPAVYINNAQLGYTNEQQKFGLVHSFMENTAEQELAIRKAIELAEDPNARNSLQVKHKELLGNKINVTGFLYWLVHEYPASVQAVRSSGFDFKRFK